MKKHDEYLFKVGEIKKILGVSRKALLVYEEMGLLTPAVKDESSGYRYYTADNMTQLRSIRSLQTLGLSLTEIKEYYYGTQNLDEHLAHLLELRTTLERNLQLLQVRAVKSEDFSVHPIRLPRQVCFCRTCHCEDSKDAAIKLRDTYIDAVKTGKMDVIARMFTLRIGQPAEGLDLMCCIPMQEDFSGPERTEFAETSALCIYYRGPYAGIVTAINTLKDYMQENNVEATGPFRSIYLEGPPSRGDNESAYITQIVVPV